MAAPSGIVWGSIVGDYGRIGIYVSLSSTSTQTTRRIEIWFWSKYSVSDSTNTLYYDDNSTSASTNRGSVNITTTSDSGGWSTTNQIKLKEYTDTFNRGTSASTRNVAASLSGVNVVGGTMTATTSYTIPATTPVATTYTDTIQHWRYVGTGGNNQAGNMYCGAEDITTFTSTSGSVTTIPSDAIKTYNGYYNNGIAQGYFGGSSYITKNIGDTFVQPAGGVTIDYYYYPNKYTITYDANGGNSAPQPQSYYYAETGSTNLSDGIPIRIGYTFLGWSLDKNATAPAYFVGQAWSLNNIGDYTLYAVWKINSYTVYFDGNGATSGNTASMTMTYDKEATLQTNGFIRDNYHFIGWSTIPDGSAVFADGAVVKNLSDGSDVTLYAVWEHNLFNNHTKAYIKTNNGVKPHKAMIFDGTNWVYYNSTISDKF